MKQSIEIILKEYLQLFPNERVRLENLILFFEQEKEEKFTDWNNVNGHITAGAFIYCQETKKFLVLYHKDLEMYLYAGGHATSEDSSPLITAERESLEETGIDSLRLEPVCPNREVPFDIDIHFIPENRKHKMPGHYHFDFRYLFLIKRDQPIQMDTEEFHCYKWIDINELENDPNYGSIVTKLKNNFK